MSILFRTHSLALLQAVSVGEFENEIDRASEISLDRRYTARDLLNLIRARMFPPHPTAFFCDDGKRYSVQIAIKEIGPEEDG